MKHIRQFAGGILITELVLASVLLVGLMAPLPGKVELKIVQSGSMVPALPVGSLVAIVPEPTYGVGDIITFGRDTTASIPTTHRITEVVRKQGSTHYVTKGDANEEKDAETVGYTEVLGKVVYSVPRLGYVLDFARSRDGFLYTIVIPAGLIILDELITMYGVVRGMRRRHTSGADIVYGNGSRIAAHPTPAYVPVSVPAYEPSTRARMDGVRRVRTEPPAPLYRERIRAGIDGYTVVLRTA